MIKSETETTINIFGDEKSAKIYTCDKIWIKKLKKIAENDPENCTMKQTDEENYFFFVPVSYIRISPKQKRQHLNENRKQVLLELAAKAREAREAKKDLKKDLKKRDVSGDFL